MSFQDPHSHLVTLSRNNYKTEGWVHNPTQDNDLSFPGFRMMSGDFMAGVGGPRTE